MEIKRLDLKHLITRNLPYYVIMDSFTVMFFILKQNERDRDMH